MLDKNLYKHLFIYFQRLIILTLYILKTNYKQQYTDKVFIANDLYNLILLLMFWSLTLIY